MTRTIAIGDIHGCSDALEALLEAIAPQPTDTIVGLGDFVDRGSNTSGVLDQLVELLGVCRFVPLIGNHEIMMFQGLRDEREFSFWMQHGGSATVASYGGRVKNIPEQHLTFLSHCVRYFESDQHFFVHANYLAQMPLAEQPDEVLFWSHIQDDIPAPHISGKTAIVGHTPQLNGEIRDLGHIKILDTFCYGDGWLTAYDVDTGEVWQASNLGELRESQLE